jgi:hypothetical protein
MTKHDKKKETKANIVSFSFQDTGENSTGEICRPKDF